VSERRRPVGLPIMAWERDGLVAALARAGLSTKDVKSSGPLFWRFESDDSPVGFGGLEIHGDAALLRSVVTLPPLRRRGFGRGIVEVLELEARLRGGRTVWLLASEPGFFERLGYRPCPREALPQALRETAEVSGAPASAVAMTKPLA